MLEELLGADRETQPKLLSDIDVLNLMRLLKHCRDYPEFYYVRTEIIELLAQAATPNAFWALVAQTCPPNRDAYLRWTNEVRKRFGATVATDSNLYSPPYFSIQDERAYCYRAISEHALGYEGAAPAEICEYLDLMRTNEAKTHARPAAEEAFRRLACAGINSSWQPLSARTPDLEILEDGPED